MAAAASAATERTMQVIRLNTVELLEIIRVCGSQQVDKCPAPFLRDYLAAGLVPRDLDLAAKVRRLSERQLEKLSMRIKELKAQSPPIPTWKESDLLDEGSSDYGKQFRPLRGH